MKLLLKQISLEVNLKTLSKIYLLISLVLSLFYTNRFKVSRMDGYLKTDTFLMRFNPLLRINQIWSWTLRSKTVP